MMLDGRARSQQFRDDLWPIPSDELAVVVNGILKFALIIGAQVVGEMQANLPLIEGCHWIDPPVTRDGDGVEGWAIGRAVGFETPRLFWLTNIAQGQWRGRHAHRDSILATFAVNGRCLVTLNDGERSQVVNLEERGPGLIIGPWIWHDLYEFSPGAAILVIASTTYAEADYIRDYMTFVSEARTRRVA